MMGSKRSPGSGKSRYKGPGQESTWCTGSEEQKAGQLRLTDSKRWETGSEEAEELGRVQSTQGTMPGSCSCGYCCEHLINTDEDTEK